MRKSVVLLLGTFGLFLDSHMRMMAVMTPLARKS